MQDYNPHIGAPQPEAAKDFEAEEYEDEDYDEDLEDVTHNNDVLINALIDLLIQKGIINEDEFNAKCDEFSEDDDDMEEAMEGEALEGEQPTPSPQPSFEQNPY